MSTNLIIGIVVALAVVGGGTYVAMNPGVITSVTTSFSSNSEGDAANTEGEISSAGSTFANLIALGRSVTCTFSNDDGAGNTSSGTMYMTSGAAQIRGDFTVMQSAGGPMEAHMVRTGGYTYIWGPAMPQGIKSKVVNETDLTSDDQSGIDENTEFSCQAWAIDNSKFLIPSDVTFMEINASVNAGVNVGTGMTVPGAGVDASTDTSVSGSSGSSGGSSGGTGTNEQCAACNQIPDAAAKAQCLAALSC